MEECDTYSFTMIHVSLALKSQQELGAFSKFLWVLSNTLFGLYGF